MWAAPKDEIKQTSTMKTKTASLFESLHQEQSSHRKRTRRRSSCGNISLLGPKRMLLVLRFLLCVLQLVNTSIFAVHASSSTQGGTAAGGGEGGSIARCHLTSKASLPSSLESPSPTNNEDSRYEPPLLQSKDDDHKQQKRHRYFINGTIDGGVSNSSSPPVSASVTADEIPTSIINRQLQRQLQRLLQQSLSLLLCRTYSTKLALCAVVASLVGTMYATVLQQTRTMLWSSIPAAVQKPWILPLITTLGGLIVGLISTHLLEFTPFSASDFVTYASSQSSLESHSSLLTPKLPEHPITKHLPALLGLCLVTSVTGFSLGPEAPVVGAGVLVGMGLARTLNLPLMPTMFAGAAGSLTGSLKMPLAGPIFALEMATPGVDMFSGRISTTANRNDIQRRPSSVISTTILAGIVSYVVLGLVLLRGKQFGGHFEYPIGGDLMVSSSLTFQQVVQTSLTAGVGGGLLSTTFEKLYHSLKKDVLWKPKRRHSVDVTATSTLSVPISKTRQVITKTIVGFVVGLIGMWYPQSFFWGEGSLQSMIDGQRTPLRKTHHALPLGLMKWARVSPDEAYSSNQIASLQVGLAKLLAIALGGASKFPGGIVFPLMSAGASFSYALMRTSTTLIQSIAVMCWMVSTQAAATRTPLSTVLIVAMTCSERVPLGILLPAAVLASYVGVYTTQLLSGGTSYFTYGNGDGVNIEGSPH